MSAEFVEDIIGNKVYVGDYIAYAPYTRGCVRVIKVKKIGKNTANGKFQFVKVAKDSE